jgi:23S rRNA G2445 N2-methylase RlmL
MKFISLLLAYFDIITLFKHKRYYNGHSIEARRTFFASTVPGLENILSKEVKLLSDVSDIDIQKSGVEFRGSTVTGLEAVVWLRTSLRVMERVIEGRNVATKDDLYDLVSSVSWTDHIPVSASIKCDCVMGQSNPAALSHTHFNSLTVKNALVDQFRRWCGSRPSVDTENPDLSLLLYLHRGKRSLRLNHSCAIIAN